MEHELNNIEPLDSQFDAVDIREEIVAASRNIFNEAWQLKILISGLERVGY